MKKKTIKTKKKKIVLFNQALVMERIAIALESIAYSMQQKNAIGGNIAAELGINTALEKSKYFTVTERPDLKISEIIAEMKKKFPVWSWYDDSKLDADFPAPKEPTTRYFLKNIEPDPETLGLSVREVEAKRLMDGITIRERLLMELAYFNETGKHLDVKGLTFCGGSRYSDGSVPYVGLLGSKVQVGWYRLGGSHSKYGVRRAVSL